jgi:hypothetical protein
LFEQFRCGLNTFQRLIWDTLLEHRGTDLPPLHERTPKHFDTMLYRLIALSHPRGYQRDLTAMLRATAAKSSQNEDTNTSQGKKRKVDIDDKYPIHGISTLSAFRFAITSVVVYQWQHNLLRTLLKKLWNPYSVISIQSIATSTTLVVLTVSKTTT